MRTLSRVLAVTAAASTLAVGGIVATTQPADAVGWRKPGYGLAVNVDSKDSLVLRDIKSGRDRIYRLPASRNSPINMDVDRVSAPCRNGWVMRAIPLWPDRYLGHTYSLGKGGAGEFYVKGC